MRKGIRKIVRIHLINSDSSEARLIEALLFLLRVVDKES
jgi:hypothetical protein